MSLPRCLLHPARIGRRLLLAAALQFALFAPFFAALTPTDASAAAPSPPLLARPAPEEGGEAGRRADPLPAGSPATVRADGDCLRMRSGPGVGERVLTCLPEGSQVMVMEGTQDDAQFRWQLVAAGDTLGWVADLYLVPFEGAPSCAPDARSTTRPGISGGVPAAGGMGLVVWGGGTLAGIENAAETQGCRLKSVWANRDGGGLVGYLAGAPEAVNREWAAQFARGRIPAGSPLILICRPPSTSGATSSDASRTSAAPLPRPWALAPLPLAGAAPPEVTAKAAVVLDEASGAVLYGKDEHRPLPPASLTKIATAIVAIEGAESDQWVVSDVDSRRMPGSSLMGLLPGDCFLLRDLVYGMMLPSGNDAALAIGRYVAGSDEAFVAQMNTLVTRLGLRESHFIDPHGLGGPGHEVSAYDLAMLARYGMSLDEFRSTVVAPSWNAEGSRSLSLRNINRFLGQYPSADGIKNGYTEQAGHTLVVSATRDGHRLYVVLLNAPERYDDAQNLFDWAFANHRWEAAH